MQKDVGAWVEQLRFEANYLAPEESRMMTVVFTVGLIAVVAVSALNLSSFSGVPIGVWVVVIAVIVAVGVLLIVAFRVLARNLGRAGRKSREYAEKYRELVSRVFLEDIDAESIGKQYAEIKRQELEWLENRFGL